MRREKKKKTAAGDGNWLVILGVAFVVLLLLVRMIAYVAHARRHW
jgi:Na+-transporting methylmalonyl-CoA/oxaloacetate decarboxylase gamma subunit